MALLAVLLLQDGWLRSLEEGKREAARSGRSILLVTICGPKG
jgi:hypothetical protein